MTRQLLLPLAGLVLGLAFCASVSADEIILDGKSCNDRCQEWMGVARKSETTVTPLTAAPRPALRRPAVQSTFVESSPAEISEPPALQPRRVRRPPPVAAVAILKSFETPPPVRSLPVPPSRRQEPAQEALESIEPTTGARRAGNQPHDRLPTSEEGARLPKLDALVAVRGAIIVETPADRARKQKQIAELMKELSRPDQPAGTSTPVASRLQRP